jgi:hypothetical protein
MPPYGDQLQYADDLHEQIEGRRATDLESEVDRLTSSLCLTEEGTVWMWY